MSPIAVYAVVYASACTLTLFSKDVSLIVTKAIGVVSTVLPRVNDVVVPSPVKRSARVANANS